MKQDLSFENACQIVKGEYPELASDIDKFLSIFLTVGVTATAIPIAAAIGPTVLTPAAIILTAVGALSNFFGVKNEFLAITEHIIVKVTSKRDKDTLKMFERMQQAYTLTCYTSFFEALYRDKQLAPVLKKIKITGEEKRNLAMDAAKNLLGKDSLQMNDTEMNWLKFVIDLPHPGDTFAIQRERLTPLYQLLANRIKKFFELEIAKKLVLESGGWKKIEKSLEEAPERALEYFKAQYYGLAIKYPEFAIWLSLQENERDRTRLQGELVEYSRQLTNLAETEQKTIDIGFKQMETIINSIPLQIEQRRNDTILQLLETWYTKMVDEPIIDDPQQTLIYPKKSEIFIPQAFQVLHYTGREQLEHDQTWNNLLERNDLSAFLLSYFNHPISVHTPLIILGQPGSGKSLLTSMVAARLISPTSSYTPIRVELRHINTEASIPVQIKDQVYKDTRLERNWGELANCLVGRPPLVIFDGYDELLQATGKVFSGYLKDVEAFQKDELTRGQPIRTIVTSRISLIDKAVIPKNATIIRLLEFKQQRQNEWISRWNDVNATYFEQAQVEPFTLPQGNVSISKLAEQPLLLMMLAIYDSVKNPLLHVKDLDQSLLYNELLRRFIERELRKDKEASQSWQREELDKAIDHEMERLGAAAISMFNRRKLYISKEDLDVDLKFFDLEKNSLEIEGRQFSSTGRRDLLPSEKMFGSFFFQQLTAVYKSIEPIVAHTSPEKERDIAYEFLHNTFGEFLTADFMLRKILEETAAIHNLTGIKVFRSTLSQKVEQLDGLEPGWFARFMYAPLFSRPVIVGLLREWVQHCLEQQQRSIQEFLVDCDTIVTNHINFLLTTNTLPSLIVKSDQHPFADLPIIGYLAIYTLNLILLRTLLDPNGYSFDETKYTSSIDGTRPWDCLTYLWRSWFSLEALNELVAILTAYRDNTTIHLKIKNISGTSSNSSRLNLVYNVSQTLADNITAGLSGLLLHDSYQTDKAEFDAISIMLSSEQLNEPLIAYLFTKQLRYLRTERAISKGKIDTITKMIEYRFFNDFLDTAPLEKKRSLWHSNLEASASLLAETIQLAQETTDPKGPKIFQNLLPPPEMLEVSEEITEKMIKLARVINYEAALDYFDSRYFPKMFSEKRRLSNILFANIIDTAGIGFFPAISQYIKEEYIENVKNNKKYIPIHLAIQIIQFAREAGDEFILNYFRQDYIKVILKQQEYTTIELAIEMIKLVYETGDQETLSLLIKKCIDLVERNPFITRGGRMVNRRSIVALTIELLKAACEIDNQQIIKTLGTYVRPVLAQENKYILPDLTIAILKFARKTNNQEVIDAFSKNYLLTMLQNREQVPVELAVELIKLVQEQKTYYQLNVESYYHKNIKLERCHLDSLPLDTIIDIRRLARTFGDNKLAQQIDARLKL